MHHHIPHLVAVVINILVFLITNTKFFRTKAITSVKWFDIISDQWVIFRGKSTVGSIVLLHMHFIRGRPWS